jgi:hypothetical protein
VKQDESDGDPKFIMAIGFGGNTEGKIEDNFENGEDYVGIIKTPYQNLMLDK